VNHARYNVYIINHVPPAFTHPLRCGPGCKNAKDSRYFCVLSYGPRLKGREPRGQDGLFEHILFCTACNILCWDHVPPAFTHPLRCGPGCKNAKDSRYFCVLSYGPRLKGREPRGQDGLFEHILFCTACNILCWDHVPPAFTHPLRCGPGCKNARCYTFSTTVSCLSKTHEKRL